MMSKWIDRYLQQNYAANADTPQPLAALSASTITVNEKNEICVKNTAGILNNDIVDITKIKNNENVIAHADNADTVWLQKVNAFFANVPSSSASQVLECFLKEAAQLKIELLPDDKRWLKAVCFGVPLSELKSLLEKYVHCWVNAMSNEVKPQKRQNRGRFAANNFLRESLTVNKLKEKQAWIII